MQAPVSIVVPAYNEGTRLRESLPRILDYLNQHFASSELIVVDDGSSDNTADVAREALATSGDVRTGVLSYKQNLGKGRAVRLGLLASRGDVALFTDADLSTPITEMPKLVDAHHQRRVRSGIRFARPRPRTNRRPSILAPRARRKGVQSRRPAGHRRAFLGHSMRIQGFSHAGLPATY